MWNGKRSGKCLLIKEHLKKESLCRLLSVLLSLCMVASLFSGVVSLRAIAQEEVTQTEPKDMTQEKITQTEPEEETREEIKARLLRQIKEEGWDPYSADMSLDEFYALMELFQEGTLPLEEEDLVAEATDLNLDESETGKTKTDKTEAEEPNTEETKTDKTGIEESDTGEPKTDKTETEEPNTGEPKADKTEAEEPNTGGTKTDKTEAEEPNTGEPKTDKTETEEPNTGEPKTDKTETEESDAGEPKTKEPEADETETEESDTGELKTEEPKTVEQGIEASYAWESYVEESDTEKPKSEEPKNEESKTEEPDTEEPKTEESDTEESDTEEPKTEEPDTEEPDSEEPKTGQDPFTSSPEFNKTASAKLVSVAAEMDDSDTEESGTGGGSDTEDELQVSIPRTMFLFSGLTTENTPGEDAEGMTYGSPLSYDNTYGHDDDDYISGLDRYNRGYTRPPKDWIGVKTNGNMNAVVIVPDINEDDPTIASDVDQDLFLRYDGYYVRQVTAQNNDVTILGAIWLPSQNAYVYYYINDDKQSTEVSTTTLPEGQKFIIQYSANEYRIEYEVKMTGDEISGDDISVWLDAMDDVTEELTGQWIDDDNSEPWIDRIFGTDRPVKTNLGEYSFTAQAPDGYTISFYLKKKNLNGETVEQALRLGTKEERDKWEGESSLYTAVNDGWALGMEPVYDEGSEKSTFSVRPNLTMGPQTLMTSGTFYNNRVEEDRVIIAVLRKKDEPVFEVKPVQLRLAGIGGSGFGRGIAAAEDYDWEADFNYNYYEKLKEEKLYPDENPYPNLYPLETRPTDGYTNTEFPNLGKIAVESWNWGADDPMQMTKDADGTYSYSWLFQTNDPRNKWYLDGLEVNSVGVTVPFFPKYVWPGYNGQEDAGYPGEESGPKAWYTETTLPDGAVVKVEYLLVFSTGTDNTAQRHYRISVRNARANVIITGMNLMLYSVGQPEFSVYELDGVTGATMKGNTHVESIQYYDRGKGNVDEEPGWSENQYKANVILSYEADHESGLGPSGIDYYKGDTDNAGANIRFKLADGYDSPYYLYESLRDGTIEGADHKRQASVVRKDDGSVDTDRQNPVVPYVSDGAKPWMKYDKGTDKPIPVTKEGKSLYDEDGEKFTDWTAIQIREVEETVEQSGGGTRIVEKQVLFPELYDEDRKLLTIGDVIAPDGEKVFRFEEQHSLSSEYIYGPDADGWYYIRVTGQGKWEGDEYIHASQSGNPYKIALLTIVARPVRYVVRYKPNTPWEIEPSDGETIDDTLFPGNMPEFVHNARCPTFFQNGGDDDRPASQFDDNAGYFYDMVENTTAAVSSVQPKDPNEVEYYKFVDWVLVGEDDEPVKQHVIDSNGDWAKDDSGNDIMEEIHFPSSGTITIEDVQEFAIPNDNMAITNMDICVLRLMPTWEKIEYPFHYKVALNWVDALGGLHEEYFDEFWEEVLTNYDPDEYGLTVKVLKDATPFRNWIARHPTYTFWDAVNNATKDDEIVNALTDYFKKLDSEIQDKQYDAVLQALKNRDIGVVDEETGERKKDGTDDFNRLGNYAFTVNEDEGTIVIWMYEDRGGLVFHKDVDAEGFIYNDEFYFTVDCVTDGEGMIPDDVYWAYPEKVYDEETGEERDVLSKDAWLVRFEGGKITNIVKNDGSAWPEEPVTYFTLHDDEGIILAVPEGRYTISELGSESGGSYMVEVEYRDGDGNTLPEDGHLPGELPKGIQWLRGREKTHQSGNFDISQVSVAMQVEIGGDYVVYTNFSNQTSTVTFEKTVVGPYEDEEFGFEITLILPDGTEPLKDGCDYFNFNLYSVEYEEDQAAAEKPPEPNKKSPEHEEWHNWRPDGTESYVISGRVVVEKDPESGNAWVSQYLLVPGSYEDGNIISWERLSVRDGIWLTNNQRLYVVCTVPDSVEEINYRIAEPNPNGYKLAGDSPKEGHANAAELAYELFVNSKLALLPATGGAGVRVFWASGIVFLLSGMSLAWLNRDLWKRRRRYET